MLPSVTAVMITGKDPGRLPLARLAVAAFLAQTYAAKDLLIVNDSTTPVLDAPLENVRELRVACAPLGALRNLALEQAAGDYVAQWDDDDYSHPHRLAAMMRFASPGTATLLRWQVRWDLRTGAAFYYRGTPRDGIHGTILHPRATPHRYPPRARGEDTVFLRQFASRTVLENHPEAGAGQDALLYVRFFHGGNTWDEHHIMRGCAGTTRNELTAAHRLALAGVVWHYRAALGLTPDLAADPALDYGTEAPCCTA